MSHPRSNVVLIGMPGAGKSTVGVLLAKRLGLGFLDTDLLIQQRDGRRLWEIIEQEGSEKLAQLEESALLALNVDRHVIATGGSAVYSPRAMNHLRSSGRIVYLEASLSTLTPRLTDFERRGIVRRSDQSLEDLYFERLPLYRRYAELSVQVDGLSQDEVCEAVLQGLRAEVSSEAMAGGTLPARGRPS